jgi:hypothetical protein
MNKGVLEAYLLVNVHVRRLIKAGKDIPELNMIFFRRCLSAVKELLRNMKVEPELAQSLKIYNASRCSRSEVDGTPQRLESPPKACWCGASLLGSCPRCAILQSIYQRSLLWR